MQKLSVDPDDCYLPRSQHASR